MDPNPKAVAPQRNPEAYRLLWLGRIDASEKSGLLTPEAAAELRARVERGEKLVLGAPIPEEKCPSEMRKQIRQMSQDCLQLDNMEPGDEETRRLVERERWSSQWRQPSGLDHHPGITTIRPRPQTRARTPRRQTTAASRAGPRGDPSGSDSEPPLAGVHRLAKGRR